MTEADRLERDLATWLADTAVPSVPDYVNDIVREATRHRQRPRWTFVERWLPSWIGRPHARRGRRAAWSSAFVIVLALALLLAAIAIVGSQPRLPSPFGRADNGLLAFERDGDIYTFDPVTGIERAIVIGEDPDHDPRWSLDGQRIAFVRGSDYGGHLVVVDADGGHPIVSDAQFDQLDTDTIAWSPGGNEVALAAGFGRREVFIVNAEDGQVRSLTPAFLGSDLSWRPPDGRELLFVGSNGADTGFLRVSVDDDGVDYLKTSPVDPDNARSVGWSPDGRYVAIQGTRRWGEYTTVLLDTTTAKETVLDATFGHLSNDGSMVAGFSTVAEGRQVCIQRIDGDRCIHLGDTSQAPTYEATAWLLWSPNDHWITTYDETSHLVWLLSSDETEPDVSISADGPASWQRRDLSGFPWP